MTSGGFAGRVALVTGAAGSLGSATARLLASGGARLVLTDVDSAGLETVAAGLPTQTVCVPGDVANEADVAAAVAVGVEAFGRVDLHHLNAGIPGPLVRLPDLPVEEFDRVVAVNLRGTFLGLRAAFRQYEAQRSGGAIVLTASIASLRGSDDLRVNSVALGGAGAWENGPVDARLRP
jgi:NAD(P)-dependent dehydrogenase (short-subunit alcohol dehydrogenase family)